MGSENSDEDRPLTAEEWSRGAKILGGYALIVSANALFWGQMLHNADLLPNFLDFTCFDERHADATFWVTIALFVTGMGMIPRRRRDTTRNP